MTVNESATEAGSKAASGIRLNERTRRLQEARSAQDLVLREAAKPRTHPRYLKGALIPSAKRPFAETDTAATRDQGEVLVHVDLPKPKRVETPTSADDTE